MGGFLAETTSAYSPEPREFIHFSAKLWEGEERFEFSVLKVQWRRQGFIGTVSRDFLHPHQFTDKG
jgi:hypothetical protein